MTDPIRFSVDGQEVPAQAGTHPADNEAVETMGPGLCRDLRWTILER
jgi:hypothetical protein